MEQKLVDLIENQKIGEPEIVDLLSSYYKLVKNDLFSQSEFDVVLGRLGITKENDVFIIEEGMTYTFD